MFALGLFIGFITGVATLAVTACIFGRTKKRITVSGKCSHKK